ncbi:hypothetical protein JOB18_046638 [Solea senegalensis]|uniref:Uncharacterized protein n=1 Tax=Solea senegalensis TaxID=28829 RepID=A0AAV6PXQ4_SOLSE|nr:hypothetical protein JOB18_046638 [Solea senegalensis]
MTRSSHSSLLCPLPPIGCNNTAWQGCQCLVISYFCFTTRATRATSRQDPRHLTAVFGSEQQRVLTLEMTGVCGLEEEVEEVEEEEEELLVGESAHSAASHVKDDTFIWDLISYGSMEECWIRFDAALVSELSCDEEECGLIFEEFLTISHHSVAQSAGSFCNMSSEQLSSETPQSSVPRPSGGITVTYVSCCGNVLPPECQQTVTFAPAASRKTVKKKCAGNGDLWPDANIARSPNADCYSSCDLTVRREMWPDANVEPAFSQSP